MNKVKNAQLEKGDDSRALSKGESLLEQGQYAAAIDTASRVLARDRNHLGALELLAKSQWRSGEYEASLDTLRHLIRLNPYEPGYHYMKAMALQSLGHYGEAVRSFGRCLTSESGKLSASAVASIQDLENWQEAVIAELLRSDNRFKAEYACNPMLACESRGFAFAAESSALAIGMQSGTQAVVAWDRPS